MGSSREPTRTESDSMGEIEVPADRYWGAQTQRSLRYFAIGEDRMPRELVHALALVKKAAARTNAALGRLDAERAQAIAEVADEIVEGALDDHFPLRVWQTGSGTQTNMNVNEVIANRASERAGRPLGSRQPIHPNDHVNLSQSTNDAFPTAMHVATVLAFRRRLLPAVAGLREALDRKARAWADVVKIGRTHMQDAVPLTLGQEFSGYVGMLDDGKARVEQAIGGLHPLALGGTAVGTGLNAGRRFSELAAAELASLCDEPFVGAPNKFSVMGSHDALVHASGVLRTLAVSLYKIANDLRLLSCGPRAGLHELRIPENEPGSSIMPGKVNPTQCEALAMLATQVMGLDAAVGFGGAGGLLQMNVYKPLLIANLIQSVQLLSDGARSFATHLVEGTEPDRQRIDAYLRESLMLVTALAPVVGYDEASAIAHHAHADGLTLREAALARGVSAEDFDRIVDPYRMAHPES